MSTEQALETLGNWRKRGRASRHPGQLWQAPTFVLGLAIFLVVALTSPMRQSWSSGGLADDLADLREKLQPGVENPEILVLQAENLLARASQLPRRAAEIKFLAGSAYYRLAQALPENQAAPVRANALQHLEEANAMGVSLADSPALQFRLGVILFQQEKSSRRALDLLFNSVEKGADQPAEGYGYLVQAYLNMAKPRLDAALVASQKQLDAIDDNDAAAMAHARLLRADIFLRKEQRADALLELEQIPSQAPKRPRVQARIMQTELYEEQNLWARAIPVWKELLRDDDLVPGGKARVLHALGLCHLMTDPPDVPEAVKAWQEAMARGGPDGQAAGLRLGDLFMHEHPVNATAALKVWSEALADLRMPSDYKNKRLEVARVREMFEAACNRFLETQDFQRIQQLATIYKKVAAPGLAEERLAQAAEAQAKDMREKAKQLPPDEARAKLDEAIAQFHRAAVAYEQAAEVRDVAGQGETLWRGSQCYLAASDFPRAVAVLEKFVKLESNENRLAEAWLNLAQANTALGQPGKARQAFYKCIEFPNTPFAFQARYELAVEEISQKNFDQARDILEQNLRGFSLNLDRAAHEKSLYKLAWLLVQMKDFDQAYVFLEKAVQQYPANPDALASREQLGDCCQKLAENAAKKLLTAKGDDARAHHRQSRQMWLERSSASYQVLADELDSMSKIRPLNGAELDLFRRALFGVADACFDLNQFPEALRRYQMLQEKYRKQAEGLMACQRVWRLVGVMVDTPDQARLARSAALAAWKMAQDDLEAMPADGPAFRGGNGVWSKENWQTWLRWVNDQLNPPNTPVRPLPAIQN